MKRKQQTRKKDKNDRNQVIIPYVEGVSVRVDRALKKYGVTTAMLPHSKLRRVLVHPKDTIEPEEQGELVFQVPCKSYSASYIGEIGRLF